MRWEGNCRTHSFVVPIGIPLPLTTWQDIKGGYTAEGGSGKWPLLRLCGLRTMAHDRGTRMTTGMHFEDGGA